MIHDSTQTRRPGRPSQERFDGEPPVQPSSLPSPSAELSNPASIPTAEPIPPTEVPAASPLPDTRRRRGRSDWWPVALFLVVLTGIAVVATISQGTDPEMLDPAGAAAPRSNP
jgi:hypothetical protein